jgi:transcriptional regulator with XRE-family HTH domain
MRLLLPSAPVPLKLEHRKTLGEVVRSYREKVELSQEQLAERADLHHNYVGEIERGEKAATIDTLVKIAKGLNVRVRDLVDKL